MTRAGKLLLAVALASGALLVVAGGATAKGGEPDLAVTKLSKPPKIAVPGTKLPFSLVVANRGRAPAGTSKLAVFLARSTKHRRRDTLLKAVTVKPLLPGRKANVRLKLRLPGTALGAYRLIACADFKDQVEETTGSDDCRASRRLVVAEANAPRAGANPPSPSAPRSEPAAPPTAAAPAFTTTPDVGWYKLEKADGSYLEAGTPTMTTLRVANGLPGQAGYTRSEIAPAPFATGTSTKLEFGNDDDGQLTVSLPFAFPFGGIDEDSVSVGTNGWLGFGTRPAVDYWGIQEADYRGIPAVVGDFYRGLMPDWSDLLVGAGDEVREVVPADESFVAFQWQVRESSTSKAKSFQVVLFPDGRFRFDYPGPNEAGSPSSYIGYSLGTGSESTEAVAVDTADPPSSSLLFTPKPAPAAAPLPAGAATLTLPRGSSLVSAGGCSLQVAPTALLAGAVSCPFSELAPGQQAEQAIIYTVPPDAPGQGSPENFKFVGDYRAGPYELLGHGEIRLLSNYLSPNGLTVGVSYAAGTPTVGTEATFLVRVAATEPNGLDEPTFTLSLPSNATFDSLAIGGQAVPCGALDGDSIACSLPSGMSSATVEVTVTPTNAGAPLTLGATAEALNAPPASGTASSGDVGA